MSTPSYFPLLVLMFAAAAAAAESPELGEPVDAAAIAAIDFTVLPNGDGLPAGSGTAREGGLVYARHCIACHGEAATGGVNDALAGGQGSLATSSPKKTVGSYWPYATTIFDYIRRAMPLTTPGILSDDETYAVTAYILYVNGIVDEETRLDAERLPLVVMPNQKNFVRAYEQ